MSQKINFDDIQVGDIVERRLVSTGDPNTTSYVRGKVAKKHDETVDFAGGHIFFRNLADDWECEWYLVERARLAERLKDGTTIIYDNNSFFVVYRKIGGAVHRYVLYPDAPHHDRSLRGHETENVIRRALDPGDDSYKIVLGGLKDA